MAEWGRIDALVNSAGHGPARRSLEITDEQWRTGMDVYLMNVIRPTRLVAPIMAAAGGGAIVNISTAWAFEPSPMFPTSAVFRAGLAAFTKLFADAYAAENVRMNNVLPGWIDSLPATEERRAARADGPLRPLRGDRRDGGVPGFGGRGLHHRAELPRRRRADAGRLECSAMGWNRRLTVVPARAELGPNQTPRRPSAFSIDAVSSRVRASACPRSEQPVPTGPTKRNEIFRPRSMAPWRQVLKKPNLNIFMDKRGGAI